MIGRLSSTHLPLEVSVKRMSWMSLVLVGLVVSPFLRAEILSPASSGEFTCDPRCLLFTRIMISESRNGVRNFPLPIYGLTLANAFNHNSDLKSPGALNLVQDVRKDVDAAVAARRGEGDGNSFGEL